MKKILLTLVTVWFFFTLCSTAEATLLTFGELPHQSIDGLSYQGVSFDFKIGGVDSSDAYYNGLGPRTLIYVQEPSLEGNAMGILTLDFASPTSLLNFGVGLETTDTLTPGFSVELFDSSLTSLGIYNIDTYPLISYTENQFTYAGAPLSRAVISLNYGVEDRRFALDNLEFESVIPEPATLSLLGLGVLGLAKFMKRR